VILRVWTAAIERTSALGAGRQEVAMHRFRKSMGMLEAVAVVALAAMSACNRSDQSQAPGETRPGLSQPPPQGNAPAAPAAPRSSSDTGKSGY
jgi:hypothetical protein